MRITVIALLCIFLGGCIEGNQRTSDQDNIDAPADAGMVGADLPDLGLERLEVTFRWDPQTIYTVETIGNEFLSEDRLIQDPPQRDIGFRYELYCYSFPYGETVENHVSMERVDGIDQVFVSMNLVYYDDEDVESFTVVFDGPQVVQRLGFCEVRVFVLDPGPDAYHYVTPSGTWVAPESAQGHGPTYSWEARGGLLVSVNGAPPERAFLGMLCGECNSQSDVRWIWSYHSIINTDRFPVP